MLLLDLHVIRLFDPKKKYLFWIFEGCVESKNKTSAKRKSTISSLNPSIIQVASFKCRADVPLPYNEFGTPKNFSIAWVKLCRAQIVDFEE